MARSDVVTVLRSSALFTGCSDHELETIADVTTERRFDQGYVIVREGDTTGAGMWVILDGEVEVSTGTRVLAVLGSGEAVGEMALIEEPPKPRSADVVAKSDVQALQITRWDLRGVIAAHPDIAMKMLHSVADRLRHTDEALSE